MRWTGAVVLSVTVLLLLRIAFGAESPTAAEAPPEGPAVWVEAAFYQISTADMKAVVAETKNSLSPPGGKVILTADEKDRLVAAIESHQSTETLGAAAVIAVSTKAATTACGEEVRYPTTYAAPGEGAEQTGKTSESSSPALVPGDFETRLSGVTLEAKATVSKDRKKVLLEIAAEVCRQADWILYGAAEAGQPIFATWSTRTTVWLPDQSALVVKLTPSGDFKGLYVVPPKRPAARTKEPLGQTVGLIIISTRITDEKAQ